MLLSSWCILICEFEKRKTHTHGLMTAFKFTHLSKKISLFLTTQKYLNQSKPEQIATHDKVQTTIGENFTQIEK